MRNLLMLSAAVSVLALGVSTQQAAALFPGATANGSAAFVQKVQQKGDEKGSGAVQGKDTGARTDGGQARSAAQSQGDRGGQARSGEAKAHGGQHRSSKVDVNVDRGRHGYRSDRRARVGVDVNRGRHGYRNDRRTRVGVDVDRRRGYRGGDVGVRQSYGYTAGNCQEILRRYRQCVAR
jgi:hypothetical protein